MACSKYTSLLEKKKRGHSSNNFKQTNVHKNLWGLLSSH